jgi:hypothetical protein
VAAMLADAVTVGDNDHTAVVAAMRSGSDFYGLIGGIVPAGAFAGRLIPLPTLALVEIVAGSFGMVVLLCGVLAAVLLVGWNRLGEVFADMRGRVLGALMLLGGTSATALLVIAEPHAGWCALLAGWSLLLRRGGRWIEAAAIACTAATIDPSAIVLALVMGAAAWHEGEPREGLGWLIVIVVAGVTWAAHRVALWQAGLGAVAAGAQIGPFDMAAAAFLPMMPPALAAAALVIAIVGWCMIRGALVVRTAAVAAVGPMIAYVPGMQSAAALALTLLPLGLVFAVEAGALLATTAISRRRITVTRVTR